MFTTANKLLLFTFMSASLLFLPALNAGMYDSPETIPEQAHEKAEGFKEEVKEGLGMESQEEPAIEGEALAVVIDLDPQDSMNEVSTAEEEFLEVALLGSASFDVNNVDQSTLELDSVASNGKFRMEDINKDGFEDLVAEFPITDLALIEGSTELTLKGKTKDNKPFEGSDMITVSFAQ